MPGIWSNAVELAAKLSSASYRIEAKLRDGMQKATTLVRAQAQANAPFKTGELRSSLTNHVEASDGAINGYVETTVDYGRYQEEGTRYMRGRFYMKRALTQTRDEVRQIVREAVKDAL